MELITELQGWKEVRIRLQGLKAALETVKLSRLNHGPGRSYGAVGHLMKELDLLAKESESLPLEILADEATSIRNKINGMRKSCETLGILQAEKPAAP